MFLSYLSLVMAAAAGPAMPGGESAPQPVAIELEAPEGCSGADAFFSTLRLRTDRVRRADENEPHTTLQVRLTRSRGQVVGELRMVDDHGGTDSRKVQGASCEDVVQALSLTAALALDPSALVSVPATAAAAASAATSGTAGSTAATATEGSGPTTAGASTSGTAPAPVRPDVRAPAPKERSEEAVAETKITALPAPRASRPLPSVEFALGPVGLTVLAESHSTGVALGARALLHDEGVIGLTLGLAISYTRNDVAQSPRDAQASLAALAATACPLRWTASILTVEPCALLLGGWLSATGRNVNHTSTVDRLWLSAGGSLRMAAYIGAGFSVELEAGVSAPLLKRSFFFSSEPATVVAETPTLSPIVGLLLTYGLYRASPDAAGP